MIIVMTGATSGIGAEALKHFAQLADTKVYVGARGSGREVPEGVEVLPLELSALKSVRSFVDILRQRIGNAKIDILVLNAGVQLGTNKLQSADGFELTFATNHLSHYLLARLLMPSLAKNGKLIFTTSDTHDPKVVPIAPKTLDPDELAHPTKTGSAQAMRAYPATKLCNLLTARSFSVLDTIKKRNIKVIAYNPGLTAGTSLNGKPSMAIRILMPIIRNTVFPVLSLFNPAFFMGNARRSGEALGELALGKVELPENKVYASLVKNKITFPNPALLALNDETRDLLWSKSAVMVGLPE
ncbi:MAG: dehydrogenase [Bacteroidia bacterium 44-10]|nr:MAG: dehydrogenase [Bacteroidia bacterium 44-10]